MRHFFTKAIVCAGVMASALALNGMAVFAGIDAMTTVSSLAEAKFGGTISGKSANYTNYWVASGSSDVENTFNKTDFEITIPKGSSAGTKSSGSMFNGDGTPYSAGLKAGDTPFSIKVNSPGTLVIDYAGAGKNKYGTITYENTSENTGKTGVNDKGVQTYFDISSSELGTYTFGKGDDAIYLYAIGFISSSTEINPSISLPSKAELNINNEDGVTLTAIRVSAPATDGYTINWASTGNISLTGSGDSRTINATSSASNGDTATVTATLYDSSNKVVSEATCTITIKETITAKIITNYTSLAEQSVANNTYVDGDVLGTYFTLSIADTSKNLTVENNNKSYGNDDISFTQRFKTNGNNRNIEFTVKENSLVQVYFVTSKNGEARSITLGDTTVTSSSDSSIAVLTTTVKPNDLVNGTKFSIIPNASVNIYDIRVTPGVTYNTKNNGATVVTSTDTYILANVTQDTVDTVPGDLTMSVGGQEITTDSVYSLVKIGNAYFEGKDYIFALQVEGANGTDIDTFTVS